MSEKFPQIIDLPEADAEAYRAKQQAMQDTEDMLDARIAERAGMTDAELDAEAADYKAKKSEDSYARSHNYYKNMVDNPSTHMSHSSLSSDHLEGTSYGERKKYDVLEAREAADAAKPFMDVAVEIHEASKEFNDTDELTGENKTLIEYAEQRARLAAKKGEARELSNAEQKILDVYKADAEVAKVKVELGDTFWDMGPDEVIAASIEADERRQEATTREEKHKWSGMALKLENYARFLNTGEDDQYKEFSTDTTAASYLLGRMDAETGETTELGGEPLDDKKLMIQAKNLHSEAEMLRFVGSHMKHEKQ